MSKKDNELFHLPIEFISNKQTVSQNLINDLELLDTIDKKNKPIYNLLLKPKTQLGSENIQKWSKYFTTNKPFLKHSQDLYKKCENINFDEVTINKMHKLWSEFKTQNNFIEKFQFVEWEKINFLNKSVFFLTFLSFYNISSPVIQLVAPIMILILPFFVLKMLKMPVTWNTYSKILIENLKRHSIGQLFFSFSEASLGQKIYILFAVFMYFYNIYQNIVSCIRFYNNTYFITNYFETINYYLDYTIQKITLLYTHTKNYNSYSKFNNELMNYKERLIKLHNSIRHLPTNDQKITKIVYIGKLMKHFYYFYDSQELEDLIEYSFGFHGYIDNILGINKNIKNKRINPATFTSKLTFNLKKMYHPTIKKPVKNNINMDKNIIITGPNAAGKTTTIKATIINTLFIQQFGYGFYERATTSCFDYIHCYLNIPDSCSRDSLFQAEARRCKNILDLINENSNKTHFCIFDELFSGTNPYEAISSAYSYLDFISKNNNVRFLLTTHYIKLCDLFKEHKNVTNKSMKTTIKNFTPTYTYKIKRGISNVKGGVCVLKNLNYPKNIIQKTQYILDKKL